MTDEITLVDRGRGIQLSNSRITVADLVPYFRRGSTYDEIMHGIPSLTPAEIALVETYYRENKDSLDEKDRQVDGYREEQTRLQRERFPLFEGTPEERMARLRKLLNEKVAGRNGSHTPGGQ